MNRPRRRLGGSPAALLLAFCLPAMVQAQTDAAEAACHQKDTTIAIMDCLRSLAGRWDKRLNAAYQSALKASESDERETALVKAERAWLAYKTTNCGWYDAQQGTIREVAGAQCVLDMTRARAVELEQAQRP